MKFLGVFLHKFHDILKVFLFSCRNEPDNDSDNNADHAGDGGVPHVRDFVYGKVVEVVAVGGGVWCLNRVNPLLGAPFDRGVLLFGGGGGTAEILGHGAPEANPHGQNQAHECATKCTLEMISVYYSVELLQMQLTCKRYLPMSLSKE